MSKLQVAKTFLSWIMFSTLKIRGIQQSSNTWISLTTSKQSLVPHKS